MTHLAVSHFATGIGVPQQVQTPAGSTVMDIVQRFHGDGEHVRAWVRAPESHSVEWVEIPRVMWNRVRPRVSDAITIGYRLQKDTISSIISIAAAVIVLVVAPYLAPIIGTVGTALLSSAFLAGTSFLATKLFPPASALNISSGSIYSSKDEARNFSNIDSDSNLLAREAYLPVMIGNRRISPPEIASPRSLLVDGIQTIDRVFGFDGETLVQNIQTDGVAIANTPHITTETTSGAEVDSTYTFIDKISRSRRVGELLSSFILSDRDLEDQEAPSNSEPRWVRIVSSEHDDLEEISIRVQIDSFLKTDSSSTDILVPLRIRFRLVGSTSWNSVPEIHLIGREASPMLQDIRIRWDGDFGGEDEVGMLQHNFWQQVPAAVTYPLSDDENGIQWQADPSFVSGAGLRDVQNISSRRYGIRITLDELLHEKGAYEWEIMQGIAVTASSINSSTYALSGTVTSLFVGRLESTVWKVPVDQGAYMARITIGHITSIADQHPCQRPETAVLALRSKGQSVRNVTCEAHRFVNDWSGSAWDVKKLTNNPAVHYRQILSDYLTYHGIDASLISNTDMVGWRTECENQGYVVSGVTAGESIRSVLSQIAEAGFARPRYSDGFGVDWFRDRSTERPVQTFSPRNSTIRLEWLATEKPVGIRARFQNSENDWHDDELQISNPFYTNFSGYEVREYSAIADPDLVLKRTYFDILQDHYQGRRIWIIDTGPEGLICERGDLVGIVTDLLDDAGSGTRIRSVVDSSTFTIDQLIPAQSTTEIFSDANIFDDANIFQTGEQTVAMISTPTGTEMFDVVAVEDNTIRISGSMSSLDVAGAHVVLTPASRLTYRCIVSEVHRKTEEMATLVLVDEAPEIYSHMQEKFGWQ